LQKTFEPDSTLEKLLLDLSATHQRVRTYGEFQNSRITGRCHWESYISLVDGAIACKCKFSVHDIRKNDSLVMKLMNTVRIVNNNYPIGMHLLYLAIFVEGPRG